MKRALNPRLESLEERSLLSEGAASAGPARLVVSEGNSLTYGAYSSNPATESYPSQLQSRLGSSWRVLNFGIPGQTIEAMIANEPTTLAAAILARDASPRLRHTLPIDVVWEGSNSIYGYHDSGAEAYNLLTQFIRARHAENFKVVVLTCLPADNPDIWSGFEPQRLIFNDLIRANLARADAVVDVAGDPRLANPDSSYYAVDHNHLDDSGYSVVASLVAPAVEHLAGVRPSMLSTARPVDTLHADSQAQ